MKIPTRWKGVCMEGPDFKKSNCNRKLIGARYYNIRDDWVGSKFDHNKTRITKLVGSPWDAVGYGTHTVSTVAGATVANGSYFGLGKRTTRGGAPSSRIAVYKACSLFGCCGATILKAIDDAIKDGVDMILISIGSSIFQSDFLNGPIAIGSFHANQKDVMIICSSGNDGPDPSNVVNYAPWIFTVATSNIDKDFQSVVVLGNGHVLKGSAINLSNLTISKLYPLAYGGYIAAPSTPWSKTRIPTATILSTVTVERVRIAPVVAYFSSRGPGEITETILKPDVTAPGVGIVAAMIPKVETGSIPFGKKPSVFGISHFALFCQSSSRCFAE